MSVSGTALVTVAIEREGPRWDMRSNAWIILGKMETSFLLASSEKKFLTSVDAFDGIACDKISCFLANGTPGRSSVSKSGGSMHFTNSFSGTSQPWVACSKMACAYVWGNCSFAMATFSFNPDWGPGLSDHCDPSDRLVQGNR